MNLAGMTDIMTRWPMSFWSRGIKSASGSAHGILSRKGESSALHKESLDMWANADNSTVGSSVISSRSPPPSHSKKLLSLSTNYLVMSASLSIWSIWLGLGLFLSKWKISSQCYTSASNCKQSKYRLLSGVASGPLYPLPSPLPSKPYGSSSGWHQESTTTSLVAR